jgi:signal transduction histidine kinase
MTGRSAAFRFVSVGPRPRRRSGGAHWRAIEWARATSPLAQDTVLALVLAATLVADLARFDVPPGGPIRPADALGYVLVAMLVLPLAFRRRWPLAVFAVILVAAVVTDALLYRPSSLGFGLIVASYTVARWCPPRVAVVALVLTQVFAVVVKLRVLDAGLDVEWFSWPLDATYFAAAWFLGYSLRRSAAYALALEQSREELAARAVDHERTRIARELHDSIGHAITAMVVHAGVAEQTLDRRPEDARRATETIGDIGRTALGDMDRLLGLLRDDDDSEILRPSLANLDGLVSEFEGCGLDVVVELDDRWSELPGDIDQAAFRIVQEALTNTLKHAGPTRVDVRISADGQGVDIRVHDDGPRSSRRRPLVIDHEGRGLLGMRERAELHAGAVAAGPCDDGFLVTAHLPVDGGVRS